MPHGHSKHERQPDGDDDQVGNKHDTHHDTLMLQS